VAGQATLPERGALEVARLIESYTQSRLPEPAKADRTRLMEAEARWWGCAGISRLGHLD